METLPLQDLQNFALLQQLKQLWTESAEAQYSSTCCSPPRSTPCSSLLALTSCEQNASGSRIRVIQQMLNSRFAREPGLQHHVFIQWQAKQEPVLTGSLNRQSCMKQVFFCDILQSRSNILHVPQLTGFHEGNILLCPKRSYTGETY